jgi:hypothetical protein
MTPKILNSANRSFRGVFRYNEKNASEQLCIENFPADENSALAGYLEVASGQNSRIKKDVFHVTLPFPPGEALDDQTYIDIARDYMAGMGYGEQPYAVFLHTDKAHLHLHVVSSRVSVKNFRKLDDYYEKWRSLCLGAIIERKYGLTSVLSERLPASLSQIASRYFEQAQSGASASIGAYFKSWRKLLNLRTLGVELQQPQPKAEVSNEALAQVNAAVASAMLQKPRSLAALRKMLAAEHVEVREVVSRQTGKRQGVVLVHHRQDVKSPTAAAVEAGIPSGQLPCFSEAPLMQQLHANRRAHKAAQRYLRKHLVATLKRAKNQEELQEMLLRQQVLTVWHTNAGGAYGVSFTHKDTTLKGAQVGKAFTYEKIAATMAKNSATAARAQVQAQPQQQASSGHFGSIGGGGKSSGKEGDDDDDDDDDEDEADELTKRRIRRRK